MTRQNISAQINIAAFQNGIDGVSEREQYSRALKAELASAADYADDYAIESLVVTGSNVLQYPADGLTAIIDALRKYLPFQQNAEISVEALPGSVTYADLRILHDHGVNRASFDMRSFVQSELDALGRTYSTHAMEVFMKMVQLKMVFFNYDITLYYGLPGQTLESFGYSIEQAIKYQAMHITLLPFPGTDAAQLPDFYLQGVNIIGLTSFQQYTPYHFGRPGYFSQWIKGTYSNQPRLGFGAGACSRIDGVSSSNTSDVNAYIEAEGNPSATIVRMEPITPDEIELNTLLEGLFTFRVCDATQLSAELKDRLQQLYQKGLLVMNDDVVILTSPGKQDWTTIINTLKA